MKVFKFGGASVNSADAVKNVAEILKNYKEEKLLIVISAMGKTTNALERLCQAYLDKTPDCQSIFEEIYNYHFQIINALFSDKNHEIFGEINSFFKELSIKIKSHPSENYDFEYDQIVSVGELLSTKIISYYLNSSGIKNTWLNACDIIKTDNTYREGKVDWQECMHKTNRLLIPVFEDKFSPVSFVITQGFVGSSPDEHPITLGREGSDYSAAIFAFNLNASEMIIWKDVPGVLNADPKYFEDTHKLDKISYTEAIELAYYGASIIHPKTIKPLQNKNIPLKIKSFIHPEEEGTIITDIDQAEGLIPSFIFKKNQCLVSISPRDFSFIAEENLSAIFGILAKIGIKINLMQNSAISFSICFDENNLKFENLISELKKDYKVKYNHSLELITIRHYDQPTIDKLVKDREIKLEQKSKLTVQLVVKD